MCSLTRFIFNEDGKIAISSDLEEMDLLGINSDMILKVKREIVHTWNIIVIIFLKTSKPESKKQFYEKSGSDLREVLVRNGELL